MLVKLTHYPELEPPLDETDMSRMARPGNWWHVIDYCSSEEFLEALQFSSMLIVQIDTDVCQNYGVSQRSPEGVELAVEELINAVANHLIGKIGAETFSTVNNRIVFAVCVHSIECWFLPCYYPNDRTKRSKVTGCLGTLDQALKREKPPFSIDAKTLEYYDRMVRKCFDKKKDIEAAAKHQPSLRAFLDQLDHISSKITAQS
ncbi:MAG: hypothetical protein ACLQVD_07535 [Capsulimonadaceae bacterium]